MEVTKTKKGWTIHITHTIHGCLEQGGVCGRRIYYSNATLRKHDIDPASNPSAIINESGTTVEQWLKNGVEPDRILAHGHIIQ